MESKQEPVIVGSDLTDADLVLALLEELGWIRELLAPALGIDVNSMGALEMAELAADRIGLPQ